MGAISVDSADGFNRVKLKNILRVEVDYKKVADTVSSPIKRAASLSINTTDRVATTRRGLYTRFQAQKVYDIDGLGNPLISPNWLDFSSTFKFNTYDSWDLMSYLNGKSLGVMLRIDDASPGTNILIRDHKLGGNWGYGKIIADSPSFRYLDLTGGVFSGPNNARVYSQATMLTHTMSPGSGRPGFKLGQNYTTFYLWKPRSVRNSPGSTGLKIRTLFNSNTKETVTTSTNKLNGTEHHHLDRFDIDGALAASLSATTNIPGAIEYPVLNTKKQKAYIKNNQIALIDRMIEPIYDWQTLIITAEGTSPTSKTGISRYYINGILVATSNTVACGNILYRLGLMDTELISTARIHYAPGFIAQAGVLGVSLNHEEVFAVHLNLYRKISTTATNQLLFTDKIYSVSDRFNDTFDNSRQKEKAELLTVTTDRKYSLAPQIQATRLTIKSGSEVKLSDVNRTQITVSSTYVPTFIKESVENWMY